MGTLSSAEVLLQISNLIFSMAMQHTKGCSPELRSRASGGPGPKLQDLSLK